MKINKGFYFLIAIILMILPMINTITASTSTTVVEFTSWFDSPYCHLPEENDHEAWWFIENDQIDAKLDCYRENAIPTTECCPISLPTCEDNICIFGIDTCREFTEENCNGHYNVAKNDLKGILNQENHSCGYLYAPYDNSEKCYWILDCECKWNGTTCKADAGKIVSNGSRLFNKTEFEDDNYRELICGGEKDDSNWGSCLYDITTQDKCETEGKILRSWIAEWISENTPPGDCVNGNDEIKCRDIARLNFFNWINFIVAVIIIIIIYFLYSKRIKKTKIKKKR